MPLTPAERSELGRIGAYARLATESPADMTAAARARQNSTGPGSRWYEATDTGLDPAERQRRAAAARDAHMARMRLARSTARRQAAEQTARAEQLEEEIAGQLTIADALGEAAAQ